MQITAATHVRRRHLRGSAASLDTTKVAEKSQTGKWRIVKVDLDKMCHLVDSFKNTQGIDTHTANVSDSFTTTDSICKYRQLLRDLLVIFKQQKYLKMQCSRIQK